MIFQIGILGGSCVVDGWQIARERDQLVEKVRGGDTVQRIRSVVGDFSLYFDESKRQN